MLQVNILAGFYFSSRACFNIATSLHLLVPKCPKLKRLGWRYWCGIEMQISNQQEWKRGKNKCKQKKTLICTFFVGKDHSLILDMDR